MKPITQPTFAAGELSPLLAARADVANYYTGLSACKNFVVLRQGGLSKRGGTNYIKRAESDEVRLIPFIFSEKDAYVLELSVNGIRVLRGGGEVIDDDRKPVKVSFDGVFPYTSIQLKDIQFCQNADTVFLTHPAVPPKVVQRYEDGGAIKWRLTDYKTVQGPYDDVNVDDNIRVYASGNNNGTTTLRAIDSKENPVGLFKEAHLNAPFYLELMDFSKLKPWVASSSVDIGDLRYSDFKIYECVELAGDKSNTVTGPNKPTHDAGEEWDGDGDKRDNKLYGVKWKYLNAGKLYGHIQKVVNESAVVVKTDDGIVPDIVSDIENASYKWAFGAFSRVNGFPSCVTFFQQRLVFAATQSAPQTVWMSGTNRFDFFGTSSPTVDSDSLTFSLTSNRINKIVGFVPLKALIVLTEGAQFAISSQQGGLSASTLAIEIQSNIGAAPVQPLSIGESALFVEAKCTAVRDMGYSFQSDNYTGKELNILSSHLFERKKIIDWAYAQSPDSTVFIVLDDGTAVVMTYFKEQEVVGFSEFVTNGQIKAVCAIPDGEYDAVYIMVNRFGNCFIERVENRQTTNIYFDSALVYEGEPVKTVSNLDHLNGENIKLLLDGSMLVDSRVVNNTVELPVEASNVIAGLPYSAYFTTLDIQSNEVPELLTARKNIKRAHIRSMGDYHYAVKVKSKSYTPKETPLTRAESEGERVFEVMLEDRYGRSGRFTLTHEVPAPLTVLGVSLEMEVGG